MWKRTYINHEFKRLMVAGILLNGLVAIGLYSDRLIAGIVLGEAAATAVNLIVPIAEMAMSLAYFVAIGVPVKYCDAIGHFDKKQADNIFGMGVISAMGMGIINVLLACVLKNLFFNMYGISGTLEALCDSYYNWMIPAMFLMPVQTLMGDIVLADGDDTTVIIAKITEAVIKLGSSAALAAFIGVKGIAIGTLISYVVSLAIVSTHLLKRTNNLRFRWYFSFKKFRNTVKLSLVDGSSLVFDSICCIVLNKLVLDVMGPDYLIVVAIVTLFQELGLIFDGLDQSLEPFVNVFLAQNSHDGLKKLLKVTTQWAGAVAIIWGGLLFVLAGLIPGWMGVTDPEMIRICTVGLRIMSFSYIFMSEHFLLTSYYLFIERIWIGFFAEAIRILGFSILCPLVGAYIWGAVGLFVGFAASSCLGLAALLLLSRLRFGREKFPMAVDYDEGVTDDRLFEYDAVEEAVAPLLGNVEEFLTSCGRNREDIIAVMTLIEELSMLIRSNNPDRRVQAECAIVVGEDITLIFCNNGKLIDLTDTNTRMTSFREYFISNYIDAKFHEKSNLITIGLNRCKFVVGRNN